MELNHLLHLKIGEWGKVRCPLKSSWKPFIKFGKFALGRALLIWSVFWSLFLSSANFVEAKSMQKVPTSQRGMVTGDDVQIYKDSDFDSQVIGQAKRGQTFEISLKPSGPFYRIRFKPGVLGWISDADIQPVVAGNSRVGSKPEGPSGKVARRPPKEKPPTNQKPFAAQRFLGPAIEALNWVEDTMGATRNETLTFFGINWSGNNTMFSGAMFTDANLSVAVAPPKYYQQVTGNSASGWIFKMNFMFQTVLPQSRSYYLYYGFGPSFTYSHFNVSLTEGTKTLAFAAEDMSIGALFDLGIAFRVGTTSPRIAIKYYWEKKQMTSLNFIWGWEF